MQASTVGSGISIDTVFLRESLRRFICSDIPECVCICSSVQARRVA